MSMGEVNITVVGGVGYWTLSESQIFVNSKDSESFQSQHFFWCVFLYIFLSSDFFHR